MNNEDDNTENNKRSLVILTKLGISSAEIRVSAYRATIAAQSWLLWKVWTEKYFLKN